jgi:putative DNA primase/helicase
MSIATIQATIGGAPAEIVYDGQPHRFNVGESKSRAGWYIAHLNSGLPIITFGSWIDGSKYTIRNGEAVDPDAPKRDRSQWDRSKKAKAKRTAELANRLWKIAKPCTQHSYLEKKQIGSHGTRILVLNKDIDRWFHEWIKNNSLQGALVIPMIVDGRIVDLQLVTTDVKRFLPHGDHKSATFTLGKPAESNKLIIATGYATGATIYECADIPVIIVFTDGNIDHAVNSIKRTYPNHSLTIAADNDIHSDERKINSGLVYSTAAAKKYDLLLAVPEWEGRKVDYNDLFIALGKQAVIDSIQAAVSVNPTIGISAAKAGELLRLGINDWLDSADHCAFKAPAGLGKSTMMLQEILHHQLTCDYFVPSYQLAIEQANRLPLGMSIAIRGRSHKLEGSDPLCAKWESADSLTRIGLAHKTMPLLCGKIDHSTGKRPCPYSNGCGYLLQFQDTAPIRFYAHEYLPLDNGKLTKRKIDVAVIDETFHDSLEKSNGWAISELMNQPETVYRELVTAIIEDRLLEMSHLSDAIDAILKNEVELESHLHPEMDCNTAAKKVKPLVESRRKPTGFIWNCKKAMELNASTRLFVGKHDNSTIFSSYAKPIQFIPKETPTAYLDASLVEGIVKVISPECRIVRIEATRKAKIIQITDSSMSTKRLLDDNDYLSSRLIHFIHTQAKINPNGAVIAPMKWIEAHKDRFPQSVKLAHFGGLRGLNTLEDCDWLVQIGRNQPPPYAVESVARAWWPLARLTLTGGYISQQRTLTAKTGDGALVWIHTHADPHCREVLEAMREQESLQALDRLRLIHGKVKQVWLFCNLPLPGIEPDELATLDGLTLPGRLAEVALRDSVVVTGRRELHERHPDVFSTEKAAKEYTDDCGLNGSNPNRTLIRKRAIQNDETDDVWPDAFGTRPTYQTATYRTKGQVGGKDRTVIVPDGISPSDVPDHLAAIHGKPVTMKEALGKLMDEGIDPWDAFGMV